MHHWCTSTDGRDFDGVTRESRATLNDVKRSDFLLLASIILLACGGPEQGAPEPGADAGVDIDAPDIVEPEPPSDPALVFDESVIRTFDLILDPNDWQWLQDNATLEQYVPATLNYDGATYEQIGMRFKGSFGSLYSCFDGAGNLICDKLSIKLKFNEYVPGARFHGLKRINLHAMKSDDSKMHDALAYKLFRDNRVPAPRTAYARIQVNGELIGLYVAVEAIDGRFTRSRFSDGGEGNLYKEVWPLYDQAQPYLDALKTNEDENPSVDKMVRFADALATADDTSFESVLESWTDVDMLMRYMAVDRLIDSWDGIVAWYCFGGPCSNHNFYWYESTVEDRVWLIPWDLDHTFEEPSPIRTYYGMPDWDDLAAGCDLVTVFWGIPGMPPACDKFIGGMARLLWPRYVAATQEVLDGDYRISAILGRIAELELLITDAVIEDPDLSLGAWRAEVDALRSTVMAKRAYIEAKLQQ